MTARDYYKEKIAVLELKNKIQECVINGFRSVVDAAMEAKSKKDRRKESELIFLDCVKSPNKALYYFA